MELVNRFDGGLVPKLCMTLATPQTVACQAPLSMEFLGKNTGMGCHFFLRGLFLSQGSNPRLLHWQWVFTTVPPRKPI